jgi:hypothetical protein
MWLSMRRVVIAVVVFGRLPLTGRVRPLEPSGLREAWYFYGLPPLEFELSFEEGFNEARDWLEQPSTKEELERLCAESRAAHKAA